MTKISIPEIDLAERMRSTSTLHQLPEHELGQLLNHIWMLQLNLQGAAPFDDELVEEATSRQGLLSRWYDLVEVILTAKQRKATYHHITDGNFDHLSNLRSAQLRGNQNYHDSRAALRLPGGCGGKGAIPNS
jgi:hypothetical protein